MKQSTRNRKKAASDFHTLFGEERLARQLLTITNFGKQAFDQAEKLFKDARVPQNVQAIAQQGVAASKDLYAKTAAAAQDSAKAMTEIADTACFDRPASGRAWFEAAIRDHLDLGRPDRVRIVFARRILTRGRNHTPGSFATQVITPGTRPRIEIRYKTSGAKAYLKEGRALRVETTINNPAHFECRKTLNAENWRTLRRVGQGVNARFLTALGEGAGDLPDASTLHAVVLPSIHNGQRAPGLRFGDPRVMALLASICSFEHVTGGLTNKGLREHMADLYDPGYTSRQATYDLRRLRLKGLIERVPGTHTYLITPHGRSIATFFTRLSVRVVVPGLIALDEATRPPRKAPSSLRTAWRTYDAELRTLIAKAGLPA